MSDWLIRFLTGYVVCLPIFLGSYFYSGCLFSSILIFVLLEIAFFEWPKFCKNNKKLWFLFPVYPVLPVLSLIWLNQSYRGIDILIPLHPFFISWVADTGGYIFGRLWGKNKICPKISPKKSWEGLFGSFLFVVAMNMLLVQDKRALIVVLYSAFITVVALCGDLFESALKRRSGLKDSGSILPGHGGFLDRFDSVFFVGVVNFLMLLVSSRFGWRRFL